MGTWSPGVNWESSPPSCNINVYLVITGEANSQLSLSHLAMLGSCGTTLCDTWTVCGLLVLPRRICPHKTQVLSDAQASHASWFAGCVLHGCRRLCLCSVCVRACVRACMRVCSGECIPFMYVCGHIELHSSISIFLIVSDNTLAHELQQKEEKSYTSSAEDQQKQFELLRQMQSDAEMAQRLQEQYNTVRQ